VVVGTVGDGPAGGKRGDETLVDVVGAIGVVGEAEVVLSSTSRGGGGLRL
jgi:hypothetical protein